MVPKDRIKQLEKIIRNIKVDQEKVLYNMLYPFANYDAAKNPCSEVSKALAGLRKETGANELVVQIMLRALDIDFTRTESHESKLNKLYKVCRIFFKKIDEGEAQKRLEKAEELKREEARTLRQQRPSHFEKDPLTGAMRIVYD